MSIVVEYRVAKGKTELARRTVVIDGASIVDAHDGGADGEPDVTFTLTPDVADDVRSGRLDVGAGFMRGSVKMSGDFGAVLQVLPVLHRDRGWS